MTFEEEFPNLIAYRYDKFIDGTDYVDAIPTNKVIEYCLDKERVKEALDKCEEYLNLLHSQPSDAKLSEEYRRGWRDAGNELVYHIKKELGL